MKNESALRPLIAERKLSRLRFFAVVGYIIILDQTTKFLITLCFSIGESLPVIPGFFDLTYIRNPGIAFGMLPAKSGLLHWFLLATPVFAAVFLFVWYLRLSTSQFKEGVALSLITGGAISNVIDRFRLGSVVDFLDFHWRNEVHYPAFNMADISICVGVTILFLTSFKKNGTGGLNHV